MLRDHREGLERVLALSEKLEALEIHTEAKLWLERLGSRHCYLACLGQFKRGKSTLSNALLGQDLLPTGVAPVTSVVTIVKYGDRQARVLQGQGVWSSVDFERIAEFVSEEHNTENQKQITVLECALPVPLLQDGLTLVDTPGLSSVFDGNTRETEGFLPQSDAAILVTGSDPPLTGDELALLETLQERQVQTLIAINKSDRLSPQERDQGRAFLEKTLAERVPKLICTIFEVSALKALQGEPSFDWNDLLQQVQDLIRHSRDRLLQEAGTRGLGRLSSALLARVRREHSALSQPIEEAREGLRELQRLAEQADRSKHHLSYRFRAEEDRVQQEFADLQKSFVENTLAEMSRELKDQAFDDSLDRAEVRSRLAEEVLAKARARMAVWLKECEPLVHQNLSGMSTLLHQECQQYFESLGSFHGEFDDQDEPQVSLVDSRYYAVDLCKEQLPSIWVTFWDRFRRDEHLREQAFGWSKAWLKHFLEVNSTRVLVDLKERARETRRGLERKFREKLQDCAHLLAEAVEVSAQLKIQGEEAVQERLRQLEGWEEEFLQLRSQIEHGM